MKRKTFYHILCFTFGYLFHASNFHLLQSNDLHNRANYPIIGHKLKLNQKPGATSVTSGFSKLFLYKLSFCLRVKQYLCNIVATQGGRSKHFTLMSLIPSHCVGLKLRVTLLIAFINIFTQLDCTVLLEPFENLIQTNI